MMRLELMKRFFDSVDDDWHSPIASAIADAWFSESADVRVLRASANFVCVVNQEGQTHYLRFNHDGERSPDMIHSELAFVDGLNVRSVNIACPIPSRLGNLLESTMTPLGLFHAVLFEALPGEEREFADLKLGDFELWGRALGELHAASVQLDEIGCPSWEDKLAFARETIPHDETLAWRELNNVADQLAAIPQTTENYGLIHYDFELDNLKWRDGTISALDFDDCQYHWYTADVAYALRDLFDDSVGGIDLADPSLQAFVDGYRTEKSLPDEELERLPILLRVHNLVAMARIQRSIGDGPLQDEPEWIHDLSRHLNGIVEAYRDDYAANPIGDA